MYIRCDGQLVVTTVDIEVCGHKSTSKHVLLSVPPTTYLEAEGGGACVGGASHHVLPPLTLKLKEAGLVWAVPRTTCCHHLPGAKSGRMSGISRKYLKRKLCKWCGKLRDLVSKILSVLL